jgi:polyribonucleotide nucleotidyltransferase
VLGVDDRGKVRLSMRVVDQETGEDITEKVGESRPSGGRRGGDGDGRKEGGERRGRSRPRHRKEDA